MKGYFQRLKDSGSVGTFLFWWIMRLAMVGMIVVSSFEKPLDLTDIINYSAGFICMFVWEIFMAAGQKSCLRIMPAKLQSIFSFIVLSALLFGRTLGLFYSTIWFKGAVQIIYTSFTLFAGYEFACAYIRKKQKTATKAMLYYVAFSVCFLCINITELFEFFTDQIVGMITGTAGDSQFWSFEIFQGTAKEFAVIPAIAEGRWPLMDTMTDIVLSTVAAFVCLLVLNLYPYRQKGRFRYTDMQVSVADTIPDPKDKSFFKVYYERLKNSCPKRIYIFWWIIRGIMLYLIIDSLFAKPFEAIVPVELFMNFACMFIWEISMAMPAKNVFRYMPYNLQTIITVGDFIAVVAGYIFNFYYEVRLWDSALHFFVPMMGVIFGYEITCALFKMERRKAPLTLAVITSMGFCFMCAIFWELFEFSCDQVVGTLSGFPHDVQHWNYELAMGTPKFQTIFDPINTGRWPLMDTMGDVVLNVAGIFIGAVILTLAPYRHKGRFRYDFDFENQVQKMK